VISSQSLSILFILGKTRLSLMNCLSSPRISCVLI
jgi:hypothetical protein